MSTRTRAIWPVAMAGLAYLAHLVHRLAELGWYFTA